MPATAAIEIRATPDATGGSMTASADQRAEEHQPEGRDVAVAHMPAVEIEIGEQEDQQRRGQHRLGAGAIDLLGRLGDGKDALEEAEIDAGIGQHRPGERRRRREDQRALDHEDDGEEQRQQARRCR